jgi:hypothetical protein
VHVLAMDQLHQCVLCLNAPMLEVACAALATSMNAITVTTRRITFSSLAQGVHHHAAR